MVGVEYADNDAPPPLVTGARQSSDYCEMMTVIVVSDDEDDEDAKEEAAPKARYDGPELPVAESGGSGELPYSDTSPQYSPVAAAKPKRRAANKKAGRD